MGKTALLFLISSPFTGRVMAATAIAVIEYVVKKTDNKLDDALAKEILKPIRDVFGIK